ncbi:hypothetical protein B0J14DRAFT_690437 [Halenospora varia]|nr:hypothetical protein B0J14DRAFT_690437 [Halenospora varia]
MSLLSLSNELISGILSQRTILNYKDVRHIQLTCRRLSEVALPHLYQSIRFPCLSDKRSLNLEGKEFLRQFNRHLAAFPNRVSWIHCAVVLWNTLKTPQWIQHYIEVCSLLRQLRSLHHLELRCIQLSSEHKLAAYNNKERPRSSSSFPSFLKMLPSPTSYPNLRSVLIDDWKITMKEIAFFLALPSIEDLTLKRFVRQLCENVLWNIHDEYEVYDPVFVSTLTDLMVYTCSLPSGPAVKYMFECVPNLKRLTWEIKHLDDKSNYWKTFLPLPAHPLEILQDHLVEMTLSMVESGTIGDVRIDLSFFSRLKTLRVQGVLIFASYSPGEQYHSRQDLVERLPASLQSLEIMFQYWTAPCNHGWAQAGYALRLDKGGNLNWIYDCQWLLVFAEKRPFYLPALSDFTVREQCSTRTAETYNWNQPEMVKNAFVNTETTLDVILREKYDQNLFAESITKARSLCLLDLNVDLLRQIFRQHDLDSSDIYHLILTCRKMNAVGSTKLYERLKLTIRPPFNAQSPSLGRLLKLNKTLTPHSTRGYWTRSCEIEWLISEEDAWINHWEEVVTLLPKLTSLQSLKLKAVFLKQEGDNYVIDEEEWHGIHPRRGKAFQLMDLLCNPAKFRKVESVTIQDAKITPLEMLQFLSLPAIKHLEVRHFNRLAAETLEREGMEYPASFSSTVRRFDMTTVFIPRGVAFQQIFKSCPALTELRWKMGWMENEDNWSTGEIGLVLRPLEKKLVKLHMSIEPSRKLRPLEQLNFTSFLTLQSLSIDAKIAFAFPAEQLQRECRNSFFQRLPVSLRDLKVWFIAHDALGIEKYQRVDYEWILNLAINKSSHFPRLRNITLTKHGWGDLETVIWEQPTWMAEAFRSANIILSIKVAANRVKVFQTSGLATTDISNKPKPIPPPVQQYTRYYTSSIVPEERERERSFTSETATLPQSFKARLQTFLKLKRKGV